MGAAAGWTTAARTARGQNVTSQGPVVLTSVQARRILAYLTTLERAVVDGTLAADQLPMWSQLQEVIFGLDGLALTIDALTVALGGNADGDDDDDQGGDEGGVREPRDPSPSGNLAEVVLEPEREPLVGPPAQLYRLVP